MILQICEQIQRLGVSDSEAGLLLDVPTSTMSDWKRTWPEFGDDLNRARTLFWIARIRRLMEVRKKDGSFDWRIETWLYKHAQVDADGERLQRGLGRMPAAVRRAMEAGAGETEGKREGETESKAAPKPKYPKDPCDYEWPGGDEEIAQAFANQNPDPDDTRYLPDGGLIITPRVMKALQTARRAEIMAIQERKAAAAGGIAPNIPETTSEL